MPPGKAAMLGGDTPKREKRWSDGGREILDGARSCQPPAIELSVNDMYI